MLVFVLLIQPYYISNDCNNSQGAILDVDEQSEHVDMYVCVLMFLFRVAAGLRGGGVVYSTAEGNYFQLGHRRQPPLTPSPFLILFWLLRAPPQGGSCPPPFLPPPKYNETASAPPGPGAHVRVNPSSSSSSHAVIVAYFAPAHACLTHCARQPQPRRRPTILGTPHRITIIITVISHAPPSSPCYHGDRGKT